MWCVCVIFFLLLCRRISWLLVDQWSVDNECGSGGVWTVMCKVGWRIYLFAEYPCLSTITRKVIPTPGAGYVSVCIKALTCIYQCDPFHTLTDYIMHFFVAICAHPGNEHKFCARCYLSHCLQIYSIKNKKKFDLSHVVCVLLILL